MQISTEAEAAQAARGLLYISFLLGRLRQPLSMQGSVTRQPIQSRKKQLFQHPFQGFFHDFIKKSLQMTYIWSVDLILFVTLFRTSWGCFKYWVCLIQATKYFF